MLKHIALAAAGAAALSALPASADTSSKNFFWGASYARQCYLAAAMRAPATDATACSDAFEQESMSHFSHVATLVNRGVIRMHDRQYDRALSDFDEAIALDPTQGEAYLNKGIVMIATDAPEQALPLFDRAIELGTSELRQAYYGRAVANELTGNLAQAYLDYEKAAALDPEWALPREQMRRFAVVRSGTG